VDALASNTAGNNNTASGYQALYSNMTGGTNTASGVDALFSNTTGTNNSAVGFDALYANTTGINNNASGVQALYRNTTADDNNAMGFAALFDNTTGYRNNAVGSQAMYHNTVGYANNGQGYATLFRNTTGNFNNAVGYLALYNNTTGSYNVAIGQYAGYALSNGSNNIYIANQGGTAENGVIRIGAPSTQTVTYVAGIENAKITGSAVYVTSSGQLGVLASSERYKTAIAPMDAANTEKLQQLRPVSFHLKSDPKGAVQYGLIAEEVDKVYPELVIRDEAGKIQGVRYDELAPILLNEVQKEQSIVATLVAQHEVDAVKLDTQAVKIASLEQQMAGIQAALLKLQPKDELVAQR
jgi:trimeric autotransporter adhesin